MLSPLDRLPTGEMPGRAPHQSRLGKERCLLVERRPLGLVYPSLLHSIVLLDRPAFLPFA
jgi:hypothetical protein